MSQKEFATNCPADVKFSNCQSLHKVFRGQRLADPSLGIVGSVPIRANCTILARVGGHNVWTCGCIVSTTVHTVGIAPPMIGEQLYLRHYFRKESWFALLPLLQFLRDITSAQSWEESALRAVFMIDDPNLHRTRYGWIRFSDLA